jgi:hypothetical protein
MKPGEILLNLGITVTRYYLPIFAEGSSASFEEPRLWQMRGGFACGAARRVRSTPLYRCQGANLELRSYGTCTKLLELSSAQKPCHARSLIGITVTPYSLPNCEFRVIVANARSEEESRKESTKKVNSNVSPCACGPRPVAQATAPFLDSTIASDLHRVRC